MPEESKRPNWAPWASGHLAALIVILLAIVFGLGAAAAKSDAFDEGIHIAGGLIHWKLGHPRIHTENGYLSQAIVALPLLLTSTHLPDIASREFIKAEPFQLGELFLYGSGNNTGWVLFLARAAVGLLTAVTAYVVYAWSRRLFGSVGGMVSLLAFVFAPIVLAHGFMATSDMAVTCFLLLTLAAAWWMLQRITLPRVFLAGAALAGAMLAKMSGPLVLPALAGMVLVQVLNTKPLHLSQREIVSRAKKALAGFGAIACCGLVAWTLIWAAYGFKYSAMRDSPADSGQTFHPETGWDWALQSPNTLLRLVNVARTYRLLPESYLYGCAYVVQTNRLGAAYADGFYYARAPWWFYFLVFLITTPIAVLLLMAMAGVAVAQHKEGRQQLFYNVSPILLFIAVYGTAAIVSSRGSGPRHLLPMYPLLCVLLGAVVWLKIPRTAHIGLVTASCAWLAVSSFAVRPNYLSYFNELVGGPRNGYRYLTDSAVDWGQDLPALAHRLKKSDLQGLPVYLSYFGMGKPSSYGIDAMRLPTILDSPNPEESKLPTFLQPGVYCISASQLDDLCTMYNGNYVTEYERRYQSIRAMVTTLNAADRAAIAKLTPRQIEQARQLLSQWREIQFTRLSAFLRKREPFDQVGNSINIYVLTQEDLQQALNGPPPYDYPDEIAGVVHPPFIPL